MQPPAALVELDLAGGDVVIPGADLGGGHGQAQPLLGRALLAVAQADVAGHRLGDGQVDGAVEDPQVGQHLVVGLDSRCGEPLEHRGAQVAVLGHQLAQVELVLAPVLGVDGGQVRQLIQLDGAVAQALGQVVEHLGDGVAQLELIQLGGRGPAASARLPRLDHLALVPAQELSQSVRLTHREQECSESRPGATRPHPNRGHSPRTCSGWSSVAGSPVHWFSTDSCSNVRSTGLAPAGTGVQHR